MFWTFITFDLICFVRFYFTLLYSYLTKRFYQTLIQLYIIWIDVYCFVYLECHGRWSDPTVDQSVCGFEKTVSSKGQYEGFVRHESSTTKLSIVFPVRLVEVKHAKVNVVVVNIFYTCFTRKNWIKIKGYIRKSYLLTFWVTVYVCI